MNWARRNFVREAGAWATLSLIPLSTASCHAGPLSKENLEAATKLRSYLGPDLSDILVLAARAPSGHNTQPWTITLLDREHWTLGVEDSRRLPAVDPAGRETLLSLGAFLENLCVAGRHYGYAVDYEVDDYSGRPGHLMIRPQPGPPQEQSLAAIQLRRTVRDGHLDKPLTDADRSSLLQYGDGLHFFPKTSAEARYLATETLAANRQQAYRDAAEEELGEWIRWSDVDVAQHRNGLTPRGMEITGLSRWYVSHFYNRNTVMSHSFREKSIAQVKGRVEQGAGWLVVSSKDASAPTLIETGRRVERMWLGLREKGIAMHPMTQMLEEAPWRDTVAVTLGIDAVPQFLLRVGYVDTYPDPMSVRMPLGWFVRVASPTG